MPKGFPENGINNGWIRKGEILSSITRRKMSLSKMGKKPHEFTKETCKKMSKAKIGSVGIKSNAWKGGITFIDKLVRGMKEYKQWRSDVFTRDSWICKTCNKNDCYVVAHHIEGLNKIIKDNGVTNIFRARKCKKLWDVNNGITLCEECHKLTDNYKGRASKTKD